MSAIGVLLCVGAVIAFIDALRRSPSEWIEADRNRGYWLITLVLFSVFAAPFYALFVLPRFPHRQQIDGSFLKNSR